MRPAATGRRVIYRGELFLKERLAAVLWGGLPISAFGPSATSRNVRLMVAIGWIVLQNSFWGCVKNFLGSLMRSPGNYVGGHMIDPISNRESS